MKDFHTKEMYKDDYTSKELEDFFKKFDYYNIQMFDLLLYFASFDPNMRGLIENLKVSKEKVISNYDIKYKRKDFDKILKTLKKQELLLLYRLSEEADLCISSDQRYFEYAPSISNMVETVEFELASRTSSYQKIKKNK